MPLIDVDSTCVYDSTDEELDSVPASLNSFVIPNLTPDVLSCYSLVEPVPPLSPEIVTPLFQVFNIYRDTYPCFADEEYARLPKPSRLRSLFYTTLVYPPTRPSLARAPVVLREPVLLPLGIDIVLPIFSVDPPFQPRGGGMTAR